MCTKAESTACGRCPEGKQSAGRHSRAFFEVANAAPMCQGSNDELSLVIDKLGLPGRFPQDCGLWWCLTCERAWHSVFQQARSLTAASLTMPGFAAKLTV